ncbi:hypothetical protein ACFQE0_11155 [Methylobacterium komagatae]|uniref:Uncharacterized protein n=1 Tax=Methylobacterium komagatae TaxID=374425 RepID=A0ABW2BJI2_9HYPH
MHERNTEGAVEALGRVETEGDSGAAVVGLSAAAVSGCLMGLLIQGRIAMAAMVAVVVPAMGFVGWWLRGATRDSDLHRE